MAAIRSGSKLVALSGKSRVKRAVKRKTAIIDQIKQFSAIRFDHDDAEQSIVPVVDEPPKGHSASR
jgi:hypothetical protein